MQRWADRRKSKAKERLKVCNSDNSKVGTFEQTKLVTALETDWIYSKLKKMDVVK